MGTMFPRRWKFPQRLRSLSWEGAPVRRIPATAPRSGKSTIAAWASDDAVQAAAHTWDNPTLEILLFGQLSRTPRPGLETHPLPGLEPSQAGVAPPLMGRSGGLFPSQCVTQVVPNMEKLSHMATETVQALFPFRLGRRTYAEEFCARTEEREKHEGCFG
jgi:hypothetical protein